MAITRTIQIDDDGSQTTGTIFNSAWKTELYDQIDAMPMTVRAIYHGSPPGATYHNWDLGSLGPFTMFQLSPLGGIVATGIVAQAPGTVYILHNSSFTITIGHDHSASLPANRILNRGGIDYNLTAWQAVWLVYDGTLLRWVMV